MKVAIIAFNNIKYSPYVKTYSNILDQNGVPYDVILPDRGGIHEDLGEKTYGIPWNPNKKKILNFLSFASQAKRILKKNHYDFVIVLTTMPAVLLSSFLVRHYKGRYIVDIRDYTYERVGFYYKREKKALEHAALRVISSMGFLKFLPKMEYLLCHNTSYDLSQSKQTFEKKTEGPIRIGYVGSVAYASKCKHLIDLVEKDDRFEFYFYGNEASNQVRSYVEEKKNDRIRFLGAYEPHQKNEIIENVDLLYNVYGNERPLVQYAVSNKLYDSFFFKKPLLTSPETVMSECASDYSFDIDFSTADLDGLWNWYHSLDGEKMISYMNDRLMEYDRDVSVFRQTMNEFFPGRSEKSEAES